MRGRALPPSGRLLIALGVFALGTLPLVALAETPPPFVLKWGSYGTGLGQFRSPSGLAVDAGGNIWVVQVDSPCRIQKFTPAGAFVTAFGGCGSGNGQFNQPHDLAIDGQGYIYVTDALNDRLQKFTSTGAFVTLWGGFGSGNGQFNLPSSLALDAGANVYVTDRENQRVQKFTSAGAFITKWGTSGSGNGQFYDPEGIGIDASGNVYVADKYHRVQKFSSSGTFLTKIGSQGNGDGQFNSPADIFFDGAGAMFVVDGANHRVQKFSSSLSFLSKWGSFGTGEGQFFAPWGITIDRNGYIYVADTGNHRIQKFGPTGGGGGGSNNTPVGTNVLVQLSSTDLLYDHVVTAGNSAMTLGSTGPAPPSGMLGVPANRYYNLTTTAGFSGGIEVCITYNPQDVRGSEANLLLYHYDTSLPVPSWREITTSVSAQGNQIRGRTASLSQFMVVEPVSATGIGDDPAGVLQIHPASPNPFRAGTRIAYSLAEPTPVRIRVHDLEGRAVRLLEEATLAAGPHEAAWDGRDGSGGRMAAGFYFVRVETPSFHTTQKVLLLD